MQLIYLYIEKYKNIKKQGFNFSPEFECSFDGHNLAIKEKENVNNIFPQNIDITAIVGKNGSGKSSIFEIFSNILNTHNHLKYFYVLNDGLKNICYINNMNVSSELDVELNISLHKKDDKLVSALNHQVNLQRHVEIYYLNISHLERDGIIKNDVPPPDAPINYLGIFKQNDFYKDSPNDITASYSEFNYDRFHFSQVAEIAGLLTDEKYESLLFKIFSIKKPHSIKIEYNSRELEKIKIANTRQDESDTRTIAEHEPANIENIEKFLKERDDIVIIESKDFKEFFKLAGKIYNSLGLFRLKFITKDAEVIKFSTGEKTILFYLQRIDLMIDKLIEGKKDAILLFDEIELYLHPNWQKRVLKIILDFMIESLDSKKLHFILATHSPFILSDIPKQNIIFLKDGKNVSDEVEIDTFGANIHTLLSHGFFMEDGLMGEFAKEKINEVIKLLNSSNALNDKEIKKCEEVISIVGEPILKRQLQKMLDSKRLSEVEIIKADILKLQARLNEIDDAED